VTRAYYNDNDAYCAGWLRNLIEAGAIAPGDVDERDIRDVTAHDIKGYTQHHFFAGIGGWSLALRTAGWPDDRPVWTGSPPCQPFSEVGKRRGFEDERHLWPDFYRLVERHRPAILFGEQVPEAINVGWLDVVAADLKRSGYKVGTAVLSACVVEARQERERLWFVACTDRFKMERATEPRVERHSWAAEPAVDRLAHGVSNRVEQIRAYGNAIIPAVAAEVISVFLDRGVDPDDDLVG
jgi:DNA (cytosine-5)-methyltransferase 1